MFLYIYMYSIIWSPHFFEIVYDNIQILTERNTIWCSQNSSIWKWIKFKIKILEEMTDLFYMFVISGITFLNVNNAPFNIYALKYFREWFHNWNNFLFETLPIIYAFCLTQKWNQINLNCVTYSSVECEDILLVVCNYASNVFSSLHNSIFNILLNYMEVIWIEIR